MIKDMMDIKDFEEIVNLRHKIHTHPCLSGNEKETAETVIAFLKKCKPDNLYTGIGGYGIIAHFKGKKPGRSVMIRCELDALPIRETSGAVYSSKYEGIAHSCGHDGHAAITCGVARAVAEERAGVAKEEVRSANASEKKNSVFFNSGDLYLLFQPEEEVGTGALKMAAGIKKLKLKFDYTIGFHNIPGYKEHTVLLFKKTCAWASAGMEIAITGKTSHAGNPTAALNPTDAVIEIVKAVRKLDAKLSFSTIVNISIGEEDYGITPGNGVIRLTARASDDEKLKTLIKKIENAAAGIIKAKSKHFKYSISFHDCFPATILDKGASKIIEDTAKRLKYRIEYDNEGERGSDDYSFLTHNTKATFFEMGSGEKHVPFHTPAFDFDDNLIPDGIKIICSAYRQIQQSR